MSDKVTLGIRFAFRVIPQHWNVEQKARAFFLCAKMILVRLAKAE